VSVDWFAGRLRELREAAGLSRKELAARAGMQSEAGIRNLEQGIRKPTWETVLALCQALKVSCEAFTQAPTPTEPAAQGRPRTRPLPESPEPAKKQAEKLAGDAGSPSGPKAGRGKSKPKK